MIKTKTKSTYICPHKYPCGKDDHATWSSASFKFQSHILQKKKYFLHKYLKKQIHLTELLIVQPFKWNNLKSPNKIEIARIK